MDDFGRCQFCASTGCVCGSRSSSLGWVWCTCAVPEPAAFITAAFWIGAVRVRVLNSAHVKTVAPEELQAEADRAAQHAAWALFLLVHPGVARLPVQNRRSVAPVRL